MSDSPERKWYGPKRPDMYVVRARTELDPGNYYYASKDGDFVTWKPGSVALHLSPVRDELRPFASKEEAEAFINSIGGRHEFTYIGAEQVGPNLQKLFDGRDRTR
jgi:hypothetical protein